MVVEFLTSPIKIVNADVTSIFLLIASGIVPFLSWIIGLYFKTVRPKSNNITITSSSGTSVVVNLKNPNKEEKKKSEDELKELINKEIIEENNP